LPFLRGVPSKESEKQLHDMVLQEYNTNATRIEGVTEKVSQSWSSM
jgi:hypothetical protein